MGLLDEWNKVKKNENNRYEREKFALGNNTAPNKKPVVKPGFNAANLNPQNQPGLEVYASKTKPGPSSVGNRIPSDRKRNILPPGWRDRGMEQAGDPQASLFDELLGKITSEWSGPDRSRIDYSPIDNALNARLGAIGGIRNQTNQNFDKSDTNLESMHRGFQNHIATEGANRFNQITDTHKQNLQSDAQIAQDNLARIKAEDMAKRQAMLQNLGIEAAGAQSDPSADIVTQAQTSIASRDNANMTSAENQRGTNLAYNQGIAQSVGQAGVERRGALQQQLQSILGKLGMAEADAQSDAAQARFQLEQNAGQQQYQQWRDNKGFLQDTLGMLQDDALKREEMAMKAGQEDPRQLSGFAGIGQDLLNSGYAPPQIQQGMGVLADIVASDYRKGIDPNAGYGQSDILMRRLIENGVDRMLAFQLATNYSKLGNTSKYEDMPY